MEDTRRHLKRLADEAENCEMIARLATDPKKRDTFERLALHYRAMLVEFQMGPDEK